MWEFNGKLSLLINYLGQNNFIDCWYATLKPTHLTDNEPVVALTAEVAQFNSQMMVHQASQQMQKMRDFIGNTESDPS